MPFLPSCQQCLQVQVTRLLVDAVTVSTGQTEREHCFLPSHKGSPFHVHKLAERVLPAELLQVCLFDQLSRTVW